VVGSWNQCPTVANANNDFNPVERVELIPSEPDGTVSMDIIPNEDAYPDGNEPGTPLSRHNNQWGAAMYAKVSATHTRVTQLKNILLPSLLR